MDKPTKKFQFENQEHPYTVDIYVNRGYNQACDDWEKYLSSAPARVSRERIKDILKNYVYSDKYIGDKKLNEATDAIYGLQEGE